MNGLWKLKIVLIILLMMMLISVGLSFYAVDVEREGYEKYEYIANYDAWWSLTNEIDNQVTQILFYAGCFLYGVIIGLFALIVKLWGVKKIGI